MAKNAKQLTVGEVYAKYNANKVRRLGTVVDSHDNLKGQFTTKWYVLDGYLFTIVKSFKSTRKNGNLEYVGIASEFGY